MKYSNFEGTEAWQEGIKACIRKVHTRQEFLKDHQVAAYKYALNEIVDILEAMLARGTETHTTDTFMRAVKESP